jgi:hypothetical protein
VYDGSQSQLTCSGLLPPAVELQAVSVEICNWPEIIFDPRLLNQNFKQVKNLTINGDPVVSEYDFLKDIIYLLTLKGDFTSFCNCAQ